MGRPGGGLSYQAEAMEPVEAPDAQGSPPEKADSPAPRRSNVRVITTFLIVANVVMGGVIVFAPANASDALVAAEVVAEPEEEEVVATNAASRPAPAAVSGSAIRAGRVFYRERGDISDIFCRPRAEETEAEWSRRVPAHCK
jgi:hypothetical protein